MFPLSSHSSAWRPVVPVTVASVVTALLIIGRVAKPHEIDLETIRFNRVFDILTAWVMAIAGYLFIRGKLAVNRQEWLQTGQVRLSEKIARRFGSLSSLGRMPCVSCRNISTLRLGAIFVQNGNAFRRCATYAAPADARVPEHVRPGDGLFRPGGEGPEQSTS